MNVLICGHRAYAAKNIVAELEKLGHLVTCFSRGEICEDNNIITGPVKEIDRNPLLRKIEVEIIVNFILLKDESIEENITYVSSLCRFAMNKNVKKLIHISSISSYPNDVKVITEKTDIDHNANLKGEYGAKKVFIDEFLIKQKNEHGLPVVFVRPGFITSLDHPNPLAGIAKVFLGRIALLMGDKKSTLPLISRDDFQEKLIKVMETIDTKDVYVFASKGENTKAYYVHSIAPHIVLIGLPKGLIMCLVKLLKFLRIFDDRMCQMVKGQFKVQHIVTSAV